MPVLVDVLDRIDSDVTAAVERSQAYLERSGVVASAPTPSLPATPRPIAIVYADVVAHDELPELLASAGRQVVKRYSGAASEVQDLKQEVAIELLARFGSSLSSVNGDLVALIMRRRYIDLVRSRLRRRLREEAYGASRPTVSQPDDAPSTERLSDLLSALEQLSVDERELLLRERGGPALTAAERQRLHRLRTSLRERLK